MEGFRQFLETQTEKIPFPQGKQELSRLGKSHFFITIPADSETIHDYFYNQDGLRYIDPTMIHTAEQIQIQHEPFIIISIPKRWFRKAQLENKGIHGAISELIPHGKDWRIPKNYMWGYFADGEFYRNFTYHAHDELYNRWQEHQPVRKITPIDQSRLVAPYGIRSYKTFHGYNEKSFDANDFGSRTKGK